MKSIGVKKIITAVVFSALLMMSSGAQAGGLFALDGNPALAERQIGLFQQAFQWLSGTWTGFTVAFSGDEAPTPLPSEECTVNCGDHGPGIDPEG
ncbi:MAG TPA: hypothetical protein VNW71_25240 [Thermoanaerobaculia bacterium]|nr:hypothetical protein [Thermoanaerobaculia bacterium]